MGVGGCLSGKGCGGVNFTTPNLVLCHGVFDVLHLGHVRHLQRARAMGDSLIVTVTPDRFVSKGDGRPVFNQEQRAECLRALKFVDHVILNWTPTAVEAIRFLRPKFFVKGPECRDNQSEKLQAELAAAEEVGAEVVFTDGEIHSSSELVKKVLAYYE